MVQNAPAYRNLIGEISNEATPFSKPWYQNVKEYFRDRSIPTEANRIKRQRIQKMAFKFYLSGDTLYKRDVAMGLLRCLDKE